jgi:hypothetical protein
MHEFELGVFKQTFIHLLRILFAAGGESIQIFNERYVPLFFTYLHTYNVARQIPVNTSLWEGNISKNQSQSFVDETTGCP